MQVSGISFEVDTSIASSCTADEQGNCTGINGERRVGNVLVNGESIDPTKTYTLASSSYILREGGNGFSMFIGSEDITQGMLPDYMTMEKYIKEGLNGEISKDYADPHGQGRIVIK